ncbi:DUF4331 domain-containing protein [Aliiroseovarius crassostreae]|uniref:DUF4331 domain-containing protein n=1 Tax=Aliiroseovarius crassostreae TaxID=154981 RepID=UPI0022065921|nr:DUF4331 domain-containing protein [Aliiroseovarius crassostreae]UWP90906.1 DUF4331 domain-containing protein [Aliiroseovarius crassostreae]
MKNPFSFFSAAILCSALVAGVVWASDHRDAPATQMDPMSDIGDSFLFRGAQTGGLTMAYTLNPLSGSGAPGTQASDEIRLDPERVYMFKLDTDGDLLADIAYKIRVRDIDGEKQKQRVEMLRAEGREAQSHEWIGKPVGKGFTTALNAPLEVTQGENGELLFIGPRRDPFFFNFTSVQAPAAQAIKQALAGGDHLPAAPTSLGAFGITDMTLIVLEVPELAEQALGYWAVVADSLGHSVDRMGRAGVQGIFFVDPPVGYNKWHYLPVENNGRHYDTVGEFNDAYNAASPDQGLEDFGAQFRFSFKRLEVLEDTIEEHVTFYAPDMLRWDPTLKPGYPNGRSFAEDAIYWTIKDVNPFMWEDPDSFLPRTSDQNLNPEKFPYAAPSINQAWKPGVPVRPVAPIYME